MYHENADAKRAMKMTQQERCPYCGAGLQLAENLAVERDCEGAVVGACCVDCYGAD